MLHLEHPQQVMAGHGLFIPGGCAEKLKDFPAPLHIVHSHHSNVWLPKQKAWTDATIVNEQLVLHTIELSKSVTHYNIRILQEYQNL